MDRYFDGHELGALDDLSEPTLLLDSQPEEDLLSLAPCVETTEEQLRNVIRQFEKLPEIVRCARFTRIARRRLDEALMTELLAQREPPNSQGDWNLRLHERRISLFPYLDRVMHCVFIQLPGAHYTIEVDLAARKVAHWEWHRA